MVDKDQEDVPTEEEEEAIEAPAGGTEFPADGDSSALNDPEEEAEESETDEA